MTECTYIEERYSRSTRIECKVKFNGMMARKYWCIHMDLVCVDDNTICIKECILTCLCVCRLGTCTPCIYGLKQSYWCDIVDIFIAINLINQNCFLPEK